MIWSSAFINGAAYSEYRTSCEGLTFGEKEPGSEPHPKEGTAASLEFCADFKCFLCFSESEGLNELTRLHERQLHCTEVRGETSLFRASARYADNCRRTKMAINRFCLSLEHHCFFGMLHVVSILHIICSSVNVRQWSERSWIWKHESIGCSSRASRISGLGIIEPRRQ
jgi:hypothetical protein